MRRIVDFGGTDAIPVEINQTGPARASSRLFRSLPRWARIAAAITTIGGIVVGAIRLFDPISPIELTVWIQDEVPVTLPAETPLELRYAGERIVRASVMRISVVNSGTTAIGGDADSERRTLSLKPASGGRVAVIGAPQSSPDNVQFDLLATKTGESLDLRLGLLNAWDAVNLRLLVIEPSVERAGVTAQTRVRGLKAPLVTRDPLQKRISNRYMVPLFVLFAAAFAAILIVMDWRAGRFTSRWGAVGEVLADLAAAAFAGALVAWALSAALTYILLKQLGR